MSIEVIDRKLFIPFHGQINARRIEKLVVELCNANAPNGVYVSSPGGRFEFFAQVAPAIERRGIVTLSEDVRSAAVLLSLLGHTRYALPESTFFFHEVRTLVGINGEVTICDLEEVMEFQERMEADHREYLEEWLRQMRTAQSWFLRFISERTGIRTPVFLDLMRQNATLGARDAIRYGIVHEIVPPEMRRLVR